MGMEELLEEEENYLLESLFELTVKGKLKWICLEYNPLSFYTDETDDGELVPEICQIFTFVSAYNEERYELQISETIHVLSGKGDIYLTLEKDGISGFQKIDSAISFDSTYEDCEAEELLEQYGNHIAARFADVLIPGAAESKAVKQTFDWAGYDDIQNTEEEFLYEPLYELGEMLFNDQRIADFHRCVLDAGFRDELMR